MSTFLVLHSHTANRKLEFGVLRNKLSSVREHGPPSGDELPTAWLAEVAFHGMRNSCGVVLVTLALMLS
jgi:hypothetical protein